MLLVALSRRMCCSRVCSASRNAGLPALSRDSPTSLPGMIRLNASPQARKPACGPPKPSGTPKRCAEPTAMSAPCSPALLPRTAASGSVARIDVMPAARAAAKVAVRSRTRPVVDGFCSSSPKAVASACSASTSTSTTSISSACARVRTTSMVCGCTSCPTRKRRRCPRDCEKAMYIASAAAVPSSSSDALETASPVRSAMSV